MSPVVQGYLEGYKNRIEANSKSQDAIQRKQQLDQMAKEFEVTSRQAEDRLAMERKAQDIMAQMHIADTRHKVAEMIQSGAITPPPNAGQNPTIEQGSAQVIPGMSQGNMPGAQTVQLPPAQMSTPLPPAGSPLNLNIPGVDTTGMTMPRMPQEQAIINRKMALPGIMEDEARKTKNEIDVFNQTTAKLKTSEDAIKAQAALDKANMIAQNAAAMNELTNQVKQSGYDNMLERERMKFQREQMDKDAMAGIMPGMDRGTVIANHVARVGQAIEDLSEVPAPLRGAVQSGLANSNYMAPPGGKKFRTELVGAAQNGDRLLTDLNELDKEYPAGGIAGQTWQKALSKSDLTAVQQRFMRNEANIVNHANLAGETPAMMRSPTLAKMAHNIGYTITDNANTRADKRINVVDLILNKASMAAEQFPDPAQRKGYWKLAIDQMPTMKADPALAPVLDKILETGNYNSGMLNPLKKGLRGK